MILSIEFEYRQGWTQKLYARCTIEFKSPHKQMTYHFFFPKQKPYVPFHIITMFDDEVSYLGSDE